MNGMGPTILQENPPASATTLYRIFWVFFIGCVAGYILESVLCLFLEGQMESRQGMIYGPFNQIYGFGAVVLVVVLQPLAKKSGLWMFLGSALLGGAFEVMCSLIQENLFGAISWDYSFQGSAFFDGRTSVVVIIGWGIIGFVFMQGIYPKISRFIDRIPKRRGVAIAWMLAVFLALNMAISAAAVHRWAERIDQIPPQNAFEVYLDAQYPDDMLKTVYPHMDFQSVKQKKDGK